jgi:DNA replication initiation complex subunit (GINS family)
MNDIINYETLRKIKKAESENEGLTELDKDFIEKLKKYLALKKKIGDKISQREFLSAKYLAEDILKMRRRKIMLLSLITSDQSSIKNLLDEEKEFFEAICAANKIYREKLEQPLFDFQEKDQEKESEKDKEKSKLKKILIREDIPEFFGYDLKHYGPFKKGDIVEAPEKIAEVLLERKAAEEIQD